MYLSHGSPDLIQTLDELIRADLQNTRDSYFWWLIASSAVVALGVILEGPEVIHETIGLFHRGSESERLTPAWINVLALFGWILIAVGVAGEGIAEAFVSKADGVLQTFNDILLTDARKEAAFAIERAASAYERAAKAEENLGNAKTAAAKAEQHAAEANRIAESERLARIRIEERLAGWKLSPEAQARLIKKLKPYPDTPFDFSVNPAETRFMETLDAVLSSSGWKREEPKATNSKPGTMEIPLLINRKAGMNSRLGDIEIVVPMELRKQFGAAANALATGLIAEGIRATWGTWLRETDPSTIHIAIGAKE
jgi:hypothetical protein